MRIEGAGRPCRSAAFWLSKNKIRLSYGRVCIYFVHGGFHSSRSSIAEEQEGKPWYGRSDGDAAQDGRTALPKRRERFEDLMIGSVKQEFNREHVRQRQPWELL